MDLRTPQNTPANNAPISSRAQQPGLSSLKEGKCSMSSPRPARCPATKNDVSTVVANTHDAHRGF